MAGFAYQRRPGWRPGSIVSPEDPVQGQPQPWDAPEPVQQQADVADVADERPWRAAPMPTDAPINTTPAQLPGPPSVGPAPPPQPQAAPAGPPQPGQQEKTYRDMVQAGPRRSILGTIAAGAIGAAAGYANAAGRSHINVDPQKLHDMANRNPNGGGSYNTALARQKTLSDEEQADTARDQAWQHQQVQNTTAQAQADYYRLHGQAVNAEAANNAKRQDIADRAEGDRQKQQELQRITGMGGRTPDVRTFPKGTPPPTGQNWYIAEDPYNKGTMLAVRPSPGEQIDEATAADMGVVKSSDGNYYATASQVRGKYTADVRNLTAENERLRRESNDAEHKREFSIRSAEVAAQNKRTNEDREARLLQTSDAAGNAVDTRRGTELAAADAWYEREQQQLERGSPQKADYARVKSEWLQRRQAALDNWGNAVRNRGGSAWDQKVNDDGGFGPSSQPYRKGESPVPIAGPPAVAPPQQAQPAQPTGGGRGGPQPVAQQPAAPKVFPRARVDAYREANHWTTTQQAEQYLKSQGYTIQ